MQDTPIYLLFHFASASQIWRLNSKLYFDLFIFCVCSLFFSALDSVPTWMTTTRTSWKGRTFWWLIMMLTMRKTLKAPTIGGTGRCLGGGSSFKVWCFSVSEAAVSLQTLNLHCAEMADSQIDLEYHKFCFLFSTRPCTSPLAVSHMLRNENETRSFCFF